MSERESQRNVRAELVVRAVNEYEALLAVADAVRSISDEVYAFDELHEALARLDEVRRG